MKNRESRTKTAKKVTYTGFIANVLLSGGKLASGIIGNSSAMIADAVHSISDIATDLVVLAFVNISGKESDETHKYGHGKFETFATLVVSMVLLGVAVGILINGISNLSVSIKGGTLPRPGIIAFWAAIGSIIVKEVIFRYTLKKGKEIKSDALIANGWHHRSDALSSMGTALGIAGAIFLGERWRILDPIAGIIVSFFIIKVSIDLALPSIRELLESSLPPKTVDEIRRIISSHPDIQDHHNLRTRKIGSIYAIDVHIKIDMDTSFVRSHDIASEVEISLREKFGNETQVIIHTEPFKTK